MWLVYYLRIRALGVGLIADFQLWVGFDLRMAARILFRSQNLACGSGIISEYKLWMCFRSQSSDAGAGCVSEVMLRFGLGF